MNEAEWLACEAPVPMLEQLQLLAKSRRLTRRYLRRKYRLFAVACCRCVWDTMDPPYDECVELAEQYADGKVLARSLRRAFLQCQDMAAYFEEIWAAAGACNGDPFYGAQEAAEKVATCLAWKQKPRGVSRKTDPTLQPALHAARARLVILLRDIIGNPFRKVPPLPALPPNVVQMAEAVYQSGDFTALPVLADALEEAGVTDAEALAHLRGEGPHARGCWMLDRVLGKG